MARIDISANLRRLVTKRARERCEYCLIHQDDTSFSHQVDHIMPLKHQGQTVSHNLALACLECNRYKGSDIAAIDPISGEITPLFNPRVQAWAEHFMLQDNARITGLTPTGRATVVLLRLNDPKRVIQRQILVATKRYSL
ncbi:MAG: HNH endonuclease [Anaerolineae bacterium]|nr:HNH endonuclease [Anaerolineae bacterium]